jgi:hypothetical protein
MPNLSSPPLPASTNVSALADWAELCVLGSRPTLSRAQLEQDLRRNDARRVELHARDTWKELARRQALMGALWPLQFDSLSNELIKKAGTRNHLFYYFLAALSLGVDIDNQGRKLFEYCVADVIPALTGNSALVLGDPRPGTAAQQRGIPSDMQEAVDLYIRLAKARTAERLEARDKDLGLDIVSWRRFADGRGAYLHFIGQCATGKEWYSEDKASDLKLGRWEKYVHWDVPPVRFFAIPFVVGPKPSVLRRASQDGGLVLDRPRLIELDAQVSLKPHHLARVLHYCRSLYGSSLRGIRYQALGLSTISQRQIESRSAVA